MLPETDPFKIVEPQTVDFHRKTASRKLNTYKRQLLPVRSAIRHERLQAVPAKFVECRTVMRTQKAAPLTRQTRENTGSSINHTTHNGSTHISPFRTPQTRKRRNTRSFNHLWLDRLLHKKSILRFSGSTRVGGCHGGFRRGTLTLMLCGSVRTRRHSAIGCVVFLAFCPCPLYPT